MKTETLKPSNFTNFPWDSILQKTESEIVAQNIMKILERTRNEFKELSWEEYQEERLKDKNFSTIEKSYFNKVVNYCASSESAISFCKNWAKTK